MNIKIYDFKFLILLFTLFSIESCIKGGNLIPIKNLSTKSPQDPIDPGAGNGSTIGNPDSLFVATLEGNEGIFELKNNSVIKHVNIANQTRLNSAVLINDKIYYSLESLSFEVLNVSEVYELDLKTASTKKISSFHTNMTSGVSSVFSSGIELYASVRNETIGTELYQYENGSWKLVKDIETGIVGSYPSLSLQGNQKSYFSSYQNATGIELWSTENKGSIFIDATLGQGSSHIIPWFVKNDLIYATLKNGAGSSYDLYSIDSQKNLTKVVSLSSNSSMGANPMSVTPFSNGVIASCYHESSGRELCYNDQLSGTWKVIDINPGSNHSNPRYFINYNSQIYFQAEGNGGIELYKSNGQSAELVKDIFPGTESSYPEGFMVIQGKLYFSAYDNEGPNLFQYDSMTDSLTKITTNGKSLKFSRSLLKSLK